MATNYVGDSIGDAARSEERARERWLNLQLQNRDYLLRQQARRDAINQANAANAMQADRLGLALAADDRNTRYNQAIDLEDRRLGLDERDYRRKQDALELKLGLEEAEKQRKLQRELNELRADNYIQRLQQTEDNRTFADLAKRIASDDIRDIPSLQDAEGGRLGSEEWVDLKTRLGQRQQRMMEESAMGPEQAAREATLALLSDPSFTGAQDPDAKNYAMNAVLARLGQNRAFNGKITPDYAAGKFNPVLGYKYSGPRDAIDWYGSGTTPRNPVAQEPPPPPVTAPQPGFFKRLGIMDVLAATGATSVPESIRGISRAFQRDPAPPAPVSAPVVDQPVSEENPLIQDPVPVVTNPDDKAKVAEVRALMNNGMDAKQAIETVKAKYRARTGYQVRSF